MALFIDSIRGYKTIIASTTITAAVATLNYNYGNCNNYNIYNETPPPTTTATITTTAAAAKTTMTISK